MNIASTAELIYGKSSGDGAIALGRNGHLNLGKHSKMIINNRFVLMEKSLDENEQAYVDLQPGSLLIFGENATLEKNTALDNGKMMLNVYMNGGVLDDHLLSEEEKKLIHRIYPEEPVPLLEKMLVYPNPATEKIFIDVPLEADGEIKLELFDLNGKLMKEVEFIGNKGNQAIEFNLPQMLSGMYLFKTTTITELKQQVFLEKIWIRKL